MCMNYAFFMAAKRWPYKRQAVSLQQCFCAILCTCPYVHSTTIPTSVEEFGSSNFVHSWKCTRTRHTYTSPQGSMASDCDTVKTVCSGGLQYCYSHKVSLIVYTVYLKTKDKNAWEHELIWCSEWCSPRRWLQRFLLIFASTVWFLWSVYTQISSVWPVLHFHNISSKPKYRTHFRPTRASSQWNADLAYLFWYI